MTVPPPRIARRGAVCVVLALLLLAGLRCTTDSSTPESAAPTFRETLRLGSDDPKAPNHRLFSSVSEVAVDRSGTLYVVDGQGGAVRVYREDGTFRRTLGQKGGGPGEFRRISALHVDRHGRLLVADATQARITLFSPDGDLLATHPLPDVRRVAQIADLSGGRYALVGSGKGHLVHVVDSTFSTVEARLVPETSVQASDHKLGAVIKSFFPGSVAALDDGRLVYAPGFYTGTLRVFTETDTAWTQTKTYESPSGADAPVTITTIDNAERVDLPIRMQNGRYAAQLHSVSWGLYAPDEKGLVHVFTQEGGSGLEFSVERFAVNGGHRGATVIDTTSGLTLRGLEMDARGNLYLSDSREVPQLVRLTWENK